MKRKLTVVMLLMLVLVMSACTPAKTASKAPEETKKEAPAEEKKATESTEKKEISATELLKNVNARLAIAYAVEKTYLEEVILGDGSLAADYYVTKKLAFNQDGADFREKYPDGFIHYDLDKAKEHWAKAKEELGFDTVKLRFLTYDQEARKKASEYIQAQLLQNLEGIEIEMDVQPFKNKLKMSKAGDFDIELASWGPDYADPMTFLDMYLEGGGMNIPRYDAQDYMTMIRDSKTGELTKDPAKRWETLQEAEKILLERDAVVAPMYQSGYSSLQRPGVKGIVQRTLPPEYSFAEATTDTQTEGKSLIRMLSAGDIPTLDSNKATDTISFTVLGNVMDSLIEVDGDNKIVPRLAESWTVSEDGLKYTFNLRKDALWSNGTPVTANDFVFSWRRQADPKTGSTYQFIVETAGIKNAGAIGKGELDPSELGVKAIDDYTLEVELAIPVPYFVRLMSFGSFIPINEAFYKEHEETYGTTKDDVLYSGPYTLTKAEPGYGYTLERNPNYYNKDRVVNDGVDFRVVTDVAVGVNLYETGKVDKANLSGEYVNQFIDRPDYNNMLGGRITYILFNINNR